MKHSTSYDDLKKKKQRESSGTSSVGSRSGTASPQPGMGFGIRKARSHPDVNVQSLQKEVDVSLKPIWFACQLKIVFVPTTILLKYTLTKYRTVYKYMNWRCTSNQNASPSWSM